MSLRKDTLSHAYELMKVEDPKKRRRLAAQVARGELSLVKLRRRSRAGGRGPASDAEDDESSDAPSPAVAGGRDADQRRRRPGRCRPGTAWSGGRPVAPLRDDSLLEAKQGLADAVEELFGVLRQKDVLESIGDVDRANLAKYLTIAKLRLENAIALVRSGEVS